MPLELVAPAKNFSGRISGELPSNSDGESTWAQPPRPLAKSARVLNELDIMLAYTLRYPFLVPKRPTLSYATSLVISLPTSRYPARLTPRSACASPLPTFGPCNMPTPRTLRWLLWAGLASLCLIAVAVISGPIWLRPIIQREASAAFRRPITIGSVRLHLGNPLNIAFENLVVSNPPGFPENEEPFARIARLSADLDAFALIRRGQLVITSIDLQQPIVRPVSTVDGQRNYVFPPSHPDIEVIRVTDGHAHVTLADLRADFQVDFATRPTSDPAGATQIVATSRGTYAALPTTARLVGDGAVHSGEGAQPWSVDLQITNGQTQISAVGSLHDPTNPRGAKLMLRSIGPDMALLKPLIGVSLPTTPHYEFDGGFAYEGGIFTLTSNAGRIGRSDLEGTVTARTGERGQADITAELHSGDVAMADIASLISGRPNSNEQKTAAETPTRYGSGLFPKTALHLPDVGSSIFHLTYAAQVVQGTSTSLDHLALHMNVKAGAVILRPLTVNVGRGRLSGGLSLVEQANGIIQAESDIHLDRVDVARLLQAKNYQGELALNGAMHLEGAGHSVSAMAAALDGNASFWTQGGDLNALIVDAAGLRLGSALLSWLAGPRVTQVQCFVADLVSRHGILATRALTLETASAVLEGVGTVNLGQENVNLRIRSHSKHFTVGVLPGPLLIRGPLADPSTVPDPSAGPSRGAIADVLSVLPGVQFGVGDAPECEVRSKRLSAGRGLP